MKILHKVCIRKRYYVYDSYIHTYLYNKGIICEIIFIDRAMPIVDIKPIYWLAKQYVYFTLEYPQIFHSN